MIKSWYDTCNYSTRLQIDIGALEELQAPRAPKYAEFNPSGGISLDYEGAWHDGETIKLPAESLAVALMRFAWVVAYSENLNR